MASPPRAGSPTSSFLAAASLNSARKRQSVNLGGPGGIKRRKTSMVSSIGSAHPLRQTSFPPQESAVSSRAPSFSPPVADELVSQKGVGGRKRKAGRKLAAPDARSQTGTSNGGVKAKTEKSVVDNEADDEADEEDLGTADVTRIEGDTAASEAQKKLENEHLRMLMESLTPEQNDQYVMWRRVKLPAPVVRKLVNQTLSQSVNKSTVTAVCGYGKLFAGEIIERALDVQTEWLAASPLRPIDQPLVARTSAEGQVEPVPAVERDRFVVHEMDKGPLLPEHLREALRRYRRDREGGGAGFHGLSLNGRTKTASRVGGKRLFK